MVLRALARLTRRERAVLTLRFYLDLTEVQIAKELGIAPGTVKSTVARALGKLRADESYERRPRHEPNRPETCPVDLDYPEPAAAALDVGPIVARSQAIPARAAAGREQARRSSPAPPSASVHHRRAGRDVPLAPGACGPPGRRRAPRPSRWGR